MERSRIWALTFAGLTIWTLVEPCALRGLDQPTLEELKERVAKADIGGRPPLCLRIAELQLDAARKFYGEGESDKARAALTDVVAFAELDREYAIQSHKHEKQSEIAIRKMVRKLDDLKHTLTHDEQEQVQKTIDELQRVRDDLLAAMFPKGVKK